VRTWWSARHQIPAVALNDGSRDDDRLHEDESGVRG
jgi:hypothetical protein